MNCNHGDCYLLIIRSELACRVSTDDLAESIMSFNTNYCDTGLFGIYSTALVSGEHSWLYVLKLISVYEMK